MPPAIKALTSFFLVRVLRRTRYVPRGHPANGAGAGAGATAGAEAAAVGIDGTKANIVTITNVEIIFFTINFSSSIGVKLGTSDMNRMSAGVQLAAY
jgi:hypothetical protein